MIKGIVFLSMTKYSYLKDLMVLADCAAQCDFLYVGLMTTYQGTVLANSDENSNVVLPLLSLLKPIDMVIEIDGLAGQVKFLQKFDISKVFVKQQSEYLDEELKAVIDRKNIEVVVLK